MKGMVPMGLQHMSDNVLVGMVIKDRSSGQTWDFYVMAYPGEGSNV